MKIQFYKVHRGINGNDTATGACASIDDAKKQFADFLESHGTRYNDYDEFHCRFVDDDSRGGETK